MEILSTGEKIKRARIYKGLTLKDLCADKISVSKMSCIENSKVHADTAILDFIADKLDMDVKYLKQDVRQQLLIGIDLLSEKKMSKEYEMDFEYYLKFAEANKYFDIAFKIMHLMFNFYIEKNETQRLHVMISKYYGYWRESDIEKNRAIYYFDIAQFFELTNEYVQAANYYRNVRISSIEDKDYKMIAKATYGEASCYIQIKDYVRAYERVITLTKFLSYPQLTFKRAEINEMLALLSLRLGKGKFKEYEQKANELYKDDKYRTALATYKYACVMSEMGMKENASQYLDKALEIYPEENTLKTTKFMLLIIKEFIKDDILDKAQNCTNEALDFAISLDNIRLIEKAYYYKAIILQKQGNMVSAEIYMILSFDSLKKFGSKQDIYNRYMDLGDLYHKMGQVNESIKYFDLGIRIDKKI